MAPLLQTRMRHPWRGGAATIAAELVEAVGTWNDNIAAFSALARTNPPAESRIQAMANTTMHDVMNAVQRRFEPYAYDGEVTRPLSVEAAIATGAFEVLASIGAGLPTPAALDFITAAYNDYMADLDQCDEVTRGVQLGHDAAAAMLALRAGDGSAGPPAVVTLSTGEAGKFRSTVGTATGADGAVRHSILGCCPSVRPGQRLTVPCAADVWRSHGRPQPCRRRGTSPITPRSSVWVGRYRSARRSRPTSRTTGWVATPRPGMTQRAASPRSVTSTPGAWPASWRTSALARADALIAAFESAYSYHFWRPVTAIRLGNLDPATPGDPAWQVSTFAIASNGPTPPFPGSHRGAHRGG